MQMCPGKGPRRRRRRGSVPVKIGAPRPGLDQTRVEHVLVSRLGNGAGGILAHADPAFDQAPLQLAVIDFKKQAEVEEVLQRLPWTMIQQQIVAFDNQ